MREHLNEEQLNEWLLGGAGSDVTSHLESCEACRHEFEELRQGLNSFRDSVHAAAATLNPAWVAPERSAPLANAVFTTRRWAYAAVLASVIGLTVILLEVDRGRIRHQMTKTVSEDQILLEIQTDVNERVPDALAPGELLVPETGATPASAAAKSTFKTGKGSRR